MTTTHTNDHSVATAARELFDRLAVAWNTADGAGYGEPFTSDADFVDIRGAHHAAAGGPAIGAGHQAIFDTIYRGSTIAYRVDTVRHLADDFALAHVTSTLDAPTGPLEGEHQSRISALLAAQPDGSWLIAALHNTLITG